MILNFFENQKNISLQNSTTIWIAQKHIKLPCYDVRWLNMGFHYWKISFIHHRMKYRKFAFLGDFWIFKKYCQISLQKIYDLQNCSKALKTDLVYHFMGQKWYPVLNNAFCTSQNEISKILIFRWFLNFFENSVRSALRYLRPSELLRST